ncbi:Resolvase, N terminal domain [Tistlia consotensis]|uniref:Resolvase, N terminal domain n=1 Tax=Tistlia consotensis USBA 355 TaxID=560819 RepID=A0A1Y6CQK4_9PROT|nr:Resolvase, N terminal domain [Tistlia consotensis USBA 355]SNS33626.1 Resolvase, N terminal domain [Tistlia consotensis]
MLKLDRLGRSVQHLANLLVRLRAQGVHFVSLSEGINTTTPGGKMVFHIFSAVAEFQRDIIVENTNAGLAAARRRGRQLGRRPKLTLEDVAEAHRQVMQGYASAEDVAALFSVHPRTIDRAFIRCGFEG